jgi:hypothetical protein
MTWLQGHFQRPLSSLSQSVLAHFSAVTTGSISGFTVNAQHRRIKDPWMTAEKWASTLWLNEDSGL